MVEVGPQHLQLLTDTTTLIQTQGLGVLKSPTEVVDTLRILQ